MGDHLTVALAPLLFRPLTEPESRGATVGTLVPFALPTKANSLPVSLAYRTTTLMPGTVLMLEECNNVGPLRQPVPNRNGTTDALR